MSDATQHLMIAAVGSAAGRMVEELCLSTGGRFRGAVFDSDARTLAGCGRTRPVELGHARLSGAGAGGDPTAGREAASDDPQRIRDELADVRILILLVCLGGGTGTGGAPVVLRNARELGITTLVFATLPFVFEGDQRRNVALRAVAQLEECSDALVVVPNSDLVAGSEEVSVREAFRQANAYLGRGLTLVWQLVTQSGYIQLGLSDLRTLLRAGGGRSHFGAATGRGATRATDAVERLMACRLIKRTNALSRARALLVGVVGGDDLRLSEIGTVMNALTAAVGAGCRVRMGTVITPSDNPAAAGTAPLPEGSIGVVVIGFEEWHADGSAPGDPEMVETSDDAAGQEKKTRRRARRPIDSKLSFGATGRGRFTGVEPTVFDGEDLDTPTFVRRGITLGR